MSNTKLLPCLRKGEHCACVEQGKQCCECGWSRPVPPDPRIAAAEGMAKALEHLLRHAEERLTDFERDEGFAALAAWDASK